MKEILLGHGAGGSEEYDHPYGDRFLGEVPASEFITGDALAAGIQLTAGVAQNSDAGWLKFLTGEGKTLYIAKRALRHSLNWTNAGSQYVGRTIYVAGQRFNVRLMTGASGQYPSDKRGHDISVGYGSEWNRLFYPLVADPSDKANIVNFPVSGDGIAFGSWGSYTEAELGIGNSGGNGGNGSWTWCHETIPGSTFKHVVRGYNGLSYSFAIFYHTANSYTGWRPVLELVE